MNYKYALFLAIFLISTKLEAQELSYTAKSNMVKASYTVELRKELLNQIDSYATRSACSKSVINKNLVHIRVIYNEELEVSDRVAYCNYLEDLWSYDKCTLPIDIIREKRNELNKPNNPK